MTYDRQYYFQCGNNTHKVEEYQYLAIAILTKCFFRKQTGAVLNQEEEMNFQIEIAMFLSKFKQMSSGPVLVVCPLERVVRWHYYLSNIGGLESYIFKELNSFSNHTVTIISFEDVLKLKEYEEIHFSSLIIDNIDLVARRAVFRNMNVDFRIGLTSKNFMAERNWRVKYQILNCVGPKQFGKLADFQKVEEEDFEDNLDQFSDWWCRLSWKYNEDYHPPSPEALQDETNKLMEWADRINFNTDPSNKNNLSVLSNTKQSGMRKRKIRTEISKQKTKLKFVYEINTLSSDEDNNLVETNSFEKELPPKSSPVSSIDNSFVDNTSVPSNYMANPSMDNTPMANTSKDNTSIPNHSPDNSLDILSAFNPSTPIFSPSVSPSKRDVLSMLYGDVNDEEEEESDSKKCRENRSIIKNDDETLKRDDNGIRGGDAKENEPGTNEEEMRSQIFSTLFGDFS